MDVSKDELERLVSISSIVSMAFLRLIFDIRIRDSNKVQVLVGTLCMRVLQDTLCQVPL